MKNKRPKKPKTYYFHSDPGHGWLAVKIQELIRLKILDKISKYSYMKGKTVYLEEDCDYSIFEEAKFKNEELIEVKQTFLKNSPIRGYERFDIEKAKKAVGN